jgi:hypothetical protein
MIREVQVGGNRFNLHLIPVHEMNNITRQNCVNIGRMFWGDMYVTLAARAVTAVYLCSYRDDVMALVVSPDRDNRFYTMYIDDFERLVDAINASPTAVPASKPNWLREGF